MEALPEALGHSAEQSQPPENLRKMVMENDRGEELDPSSGSTSSSLMHDPIIIPLPLFYSPRREVVITRYIMFILCPFGQRY